MGPEVLPDVNQQLLRTLGLKEGDILRVMKFLDNKYDRHLQVASPTGQDEGSSGGLFAGPGGVLKNNTRKGRPAPAVQTNDVVDESAFKEKSESAGVKTPLADAKSSSAGKSNGFDDDAWDVKPQRSQTPRAAAAPAPQEPPKPLINDDIASLSISAPPLQPTPAPQPQPAVQAQQTAQAAPAPAPVANQAIFDKIASLAPAARQQQPQPTGFQQPMQTGYQQQPMQPQQTAMPRQRPAAPLQTGGGSFGMPPPPRAASAPGFPPQQQSSFGPPPLQAQLTGYQPQNQMPQQQQFQPMQPQQTAYQPQGVNQGFQQQNSIQAMQQNYPPMQPQPTGFQPQSQFGQQYGQQQPTGFQQPMQTGYQQQFVNGAQTGSPFADPPRQPYQQMPSGLSNSFTAQQTGFQPSFNMTQPTGMNGYANPAVPNLPPQQTGGVFGPSQPLSIPAAPLVPQKTGPPPPVRFGMQPGAKPLMPQPTGRANLSKASKYNCLRRYNVCIY